MLKYLQLNCVKLCHQNIYKFPGGFQNSEEENITFLASLRVVITLSHL